MKAGKIVEDIQFMFETGDERNQRNCTKLSTVAWNSIVDNMIDILYHKMAREYKMIPQQLIDLITINPNLSVNLNTDAQGQFLRCFVGFPIALHVGTLTLPILIADCFFYRTPSFNGVVFNLCSKTPYGDTILLCFAILPIKKSRHLAWTIQCCVRHRMSFDFPLFTDQGPLIATAKVLQSNKQTIEDDIGEVADRLLKIF